MREAERETLRLTHIERKRFSKIPPGEPPYLAPLSVEQQCPVVSGGGKSIDIQSCRNKYESPFKAGKVGKKSTCQRGQLFLLMMKQYIHCYMQVN